MQITGEDDGNKQPTEKITRRAGAKHKESPRKSHFPDQIRGETTASTTNQQQRAAETSKSTKKIKGWSCKTARRGPRQTVSRLEKGRFRTARVLLGVVFSSSCPGMFCGAILLDVCRIRPVSRPGTFCGAILVDVCHIRPV